MRNAQLMSAAIYVLFISLATVLFHDGLGADVTAIIGMTKPVAGVLPVLLSVAAIGSQFSAAVYREYQYRVDKQLGKELAVPGFPEQIVMDRLKNTWKDTASAVVGEWIGLIYQYTNVDRKKPFMQGVDMDNPLGL